MEFYKRTNHENKGLISVDRRTKPTLILTIPRSLFKSSTKDLSFPIFEIMIQDTQWRPALVRLQSPSQVYDLGAALKNRANVIRLTSGKVDIVAFPAWILT